MAIRVQLDDATIDAIARRVVDLLPGGGPPARWLTAAELAEMTGYSRDWIYAHADQLGAIRLGDGPAARLRFDVRKVEAISARPDRKLSEEVEIKVRRVTRRNDLHPGGNLLPIHGELEDGA